MAKQEQLQHLKALADELSGTRSAARLIPEYMVLLRSYQEQEHQNMRLKARLHQLEASLRLLAQEALAPCPRRSPGRSTSALSINPADGSHVSFRALPPASCWDASWDARLHLLGVSELLLIHRQWLEDMAVMVPKAEHGGPGSDHYHQLVMSMDKYSWFNQRAIMLIPETWRQRSKFRMDTFEAYEGPTKDFCLDFLRKRTCYLSAAVQLWQYDETASKLRQQYAQLLARYNDLLQREARRRAERAAQARARATARQLARDEQAGGAMGTAGMGVQGGPSAQMPVGLGGVPGQMLPAQGQGFQGAGGPSGQMLTGQGQGLPGLGGVPAQMLPQHGQGFQGQDGLQGQIQGQSFQGQSAGQGQMLLQGLQGQRQQQGHMLPGQGQGFQGQAGPLGQTLPGYGQGLSGQGSLHGHMLQQGLQGQGGQQGQMLMGQGQMLMGQGQSGQPGQMLMGQGAPGLTTQGQSWLCMPGPSMDVQGPGAQPHIPQHHAGFPAAFAAPPVQLLQNSGAVSPSPSGGSLPLLFSSSGSPEEQLLRSPVAAVASGSAGNGCNPVETGCGSMGTNGGGAELVGGSSHGSAGVARGVAAACAGGGAAAAPAPEAPPRRGLNPLDDVLQAMDANLWKQRMALKQFMYGLWHSRREKDAIDVAKAYLLLYPLPLVIVDFAEVLSPQEDLPEGAPTLAPSTSSLGLDAGHAEGS